ncbi:uncharacterized mitochondrial protein AtMg00820-like [Solanum tuberosum]|uniref:uncharacterized mitochondrial protein AtMg00820-like n=1 Tax=Solanum tuberosum TaxID=4113 RepID=UPI00073A3293|nr:PREDICTED: uncharacterized mitochondrial protein AtMg00820-like [Solanum tuberosum]
MHFVGYSLQSKAYRLYNPISVKVIINRNVVLNEDASWNFNSENMISNIRLLSTDEEHAVDSGNSTNFFPLSSSVSSSIAPSTTFAPDVSSVEPIPLRRSTRGNKLNPKYSNSVNTSFQFVLLVLDHVCYEEAIEQFEWKDAMTEEIQAIERNSTLELVDAHEGKNVIGLKWVFRTKYNYHGSIQKHTTRLVKKGYSQQQGIDFEETFSPVARFETMRVLLALAAQLCLLVFNLM